MMPSNFKGEKYALLSIKVCLFLSVMAVKYTLCEHVIAHVDTGITTVS